MTFADLRSAYKRAIGVMDIRADGPFTVIDRTGPCVAARNYALLLDSGSVQPNRLEDLVILNDWARSLNRYADRNVVRDDDLAKIAFSSFVSRMPLNPTLLA